MTGRDPLAPWTEADFPPELVHPGWMAEGGNTRLDALRPLIAAANELAAAAEVLSRDIRYVTDLAQIVRDLTTPKGDTP